MFTTLENAVFSVLSRVFLFPKIAGKCKFFLFFINRVFTLFLSVNLSVFLKKLSVNLSVFLKKLSVNLSVFLQNFTRNFSLLVLFFFFHGMTINRLHCIVRLPTTRRHYVCIRHSVFVSIRRIIMT